MSSARVAVAGAVLVALLAMAVAARPPDLGPVMPEADGVHPVRALIALRTAFAPGGGFLDKYPPLGSFLFGLVVKAGGAPGLSAQAEAIVAAPAETRRAALWELRHEIAAALAHERWLSRLAMGVAAAAVFLIGRRLAQTACETSVWAHAGPAVAAVLFAVAPVVRVYAGTTNVDALALAASLLAVLLLLHARWIGAGAALALAVALKDPQVALVPVLLGGAAWLGGRRALLATVAVAAVVYALASGALTGPAIWHQHIAYLSSGGVEHVRGIERGDLSAWGRLLLHAAVLLFGGAGSVVVVLVAFGPGRGSGARREWVLVLLTALAPVALFVLPVGFVFARFLLTTLALLFALLGASAARGLLAAAAFGPQARAVVGAALLLLAATLGVLKLSSRIDGGDDARAAVPALLAELAPAGGRALLFADGREHGPPLDPARWRLEARSLDEVGAGLAALRDAPEAERPEIVLVMGFPNDPPSGAPAADPPPPKRGEKVGGLYEVAEVLRAPRDWLNRSISWEPDITVLRRAEPGREGRGGR